MTTKDTLKQWFKNGKKPDESQFSEWIDSFWHKDEKLPIDIIENINNILANKSDTSLVNSLINQLEGKVDKDVTESLKKYIREIIDDSLNHASDKTYSIDKIQQIVETFDQKLSTKAESSSLGILLEQLDYKADKKGLQNLSNYVYRLIDDSKSSASDKTYSIDKIQEIINKCVKDAIVDNKYSNLNNTFSVQHQNEESPYSKAMFAQRDIEIKPSGKINFPFTNDFEDYKENGQFLNKCYYRKINNKVYIEGVFHPISPNLALDQYETLIGILPEEYRPTSVVFRPIATSSTNLNTSVRIDPNGEVRASAFGNNWTSFSGVSFFVD